MKWWWRISLLVLLFPASLLAQQQGGRENDCFVRVLCDKKQLVEGDSCLLTVVAYAPQPFLVKGSPSRIQVKNGRLRKLPIGRQQLQQVVENRYLYYALVCEQYVLHPQKTGRVIVPERNFNLEVHLQERSRDPFDVFFGRPGKVRKVAVKVLSDKFQLEVVEKPKRTMLEMKRSGIQVL